MRIPTPAEIGLPPKFERFSPAQEDAIRKLLMSPKRDSVLCGSTGFGKTVVVVSWALISRQPTCFVTDNRSLQDQYMYDFGPIGMVDIRGRQNYICDMRPDYTCEQGYASRCPHKGTIGCPSSQAEMRAAASMLVVTNYDKWTAARRFGQGMQHFTQVVFDEGHRAQAAVARAMQVTLGAREVQETLGIEFPSPSTAEDLVNWKPWAVAARAEAEEMLAAARETLRAQPIPPGAVAHYLHMRNLVRRLAIIATARPESWIVDEVQRGYQFDPIRIGAYTESVLTLNIPRIVFISATIRPQTMFKMGIGKDAFDFWEFDSDFDPLRCPIYYVPTMRVDSRATDLRPLWVRHDQIAARRTDRKGIDHTFSYARRDDILAASRFASAMLINERGEPSAATIKQFRESGPGAILVSPSVGEGFDFPYKDAEWQFICKIPFPDSRAKIVKARQADDPEYAPLEAVTKLQQAAGRIMRRKDDQGETFICDDHLQWFMNRWGYLFARSFFRFYRPVTVLPQPPARL